MIPLHLKTTGIAFVAALSGLLIGFTYNKPSISPEASLKPYSGMMVQENQHTPDLKEIKQQLSSIENSMNALLKIHEDQALNQENEKSSHGLEPSEQKSYRSEQSLPPEQKEPASSRISTFENLE